MNKIKVIYILSLSHSGSTFLDLQIGQHSKVLSLGEISSFINKKRDTIEGTHNLCSCGKNLKNCFFWSHIENNRSSYIENYKLLLEKAESFGYKCIVDSSKNIEDLNALKELEKEGYISLFVLFLIRDPRGWCLSNKKVYEKRLLKGGLSFRSKLRLKKRLGLDYLYYYFKWMKKNERIFDCLKKNEFNYLKVKYKDITLRNEVVLKTVFDFLNLQKDLLCSDYSESHLVYGNRMKKNFKDRCKVIYDYQWFNRFWLNFNFIIFWILKPDWKNIYDK